MRMMALVVAGLLVGCAGGGMDSEAPDAQAMPTQTSTGGWGGAGGAGGSGGSAAPAPDAGTPNPSPSPDAMPAAAPPPDAMPAPAGPPQACASKEQIQVAVCMKDKKVLYRSDGRACDFCATYMSDGRTVDHQFVGCTVGAGAICVQSCDECQPR
jgi:hypothetical protein